MRRFWRSGKRNLELWEGDDPEPSAIYGYQAKTYAVFYFGNMTLNSSGAFLGDRPLYLYVLLYSTIFTITCKYVGASKFRYLV